MRLILTLLWLTGMLSAQTTQPVWTPVFLNKNTTGLFILPANNGQSQHTLQITLTNGSGTCSSTLAQLVSFQVEGAYSKTSTFFPISPALISDGTLAFYGFGYGSFPFIRINYLTARSECNATVNYTGNVATMAIPQSVQTSGLGYKRSTFTAGGAGTNLLISNASFPTTKTVMHGLAFSAPVTTSNVITLQEYSDDCVTPISTGEAIPFRFTSTSLTPVIIPLSEIPFWKSTTAGSRVCMTTSAAAMNVVIWYRFEQ